MRKNKKEKALRRLEAYKSWREAWAKHLDEMTSLYDLMEFIVDSSDRPLKIDRSPYAWWKNHAS